MFAMLGGSFSNILLDYIFLFPLDMRIFGAVFATVLSPLISILVLSPYLFKKKHSFRLIKTKLYIRFFKRSFLLDSPRLFQNFPLALSLSFLILSF